MSDQEHITSLMLEIERLRLRITALEAAEAFRNGSLNAQAQAEPPVVLTYSKPSAPPHNEESEP